MLKLLAFLLFFFTVGVLPFLVVAALVTVGSWLEKFYQARIYPRKIAKQLSDKIFTTWMWTLFLSWLSTVALMVYLTPTGPAQILVMLANTTGYQTTQIHIELNEEVDQKLINRTLLSWIRANRRTIKRRATSSAGGRGPVRSYIDTAYIPSRYRQTDQQIDIVMGQTLSEEWRWMLENGWKNQPAQFLPSERLPAQLESQGETIGIYVQPLTAFYEQHPRGQCRLQVTANMRPILLFDLSGGIDKDKPIHLRMDASWPGNIRNFKLEAVKVKSGWKSLSPRAAREVLYLIPLDGLQQDMSCNEIREVESSVLAGMSLRNRIVRWDELQPHIKEVRVKKTHFLPWLAGGGWLL